MAKSHATLANLASVAAILSLLLAGLGAFFPGVISDAATALAGSGDRDAQGNLRAEYVSRQAAVCVWMLVAVALMAGGLMTGVYHAGALFQANLVAVGKPQSDRKRAFPLLVIGLVCLSSGMILPRGVFAVTNPTVLGQNHPLLSWAVRSPWLGGTLLGLLVALLAVAAAWVLYEAAVKWRVRRRIAEYRRLLET